MGACTKMRCTLMHDWPANPKRAEGDRGNRRVEVGVLVHDHAGVAAQFERDVLLSALFLELPADGRGCR